MIDKQNQTMNDEIKGRKEFLSTYENMLNEKPYDENILEEVFDNQEIYKQGNRKHCAYLPYEGIKKVLLHEKEKTK